jgi:hypothetical protein
LHYTVGGGTSTNCTLPGLTGGTAGASVDLTGYQKTLKNGCTAGSYVTNVAVDGTVTCGAPSYSCPAGQFIQGIDAGTVTCGTPSGGSAVSTSGSCVRSTGNPSTIVGPVVYPATSGSTLGGGATCSCAAGWTMVSQGGSPGTLAYTCSK